ncbi:MAG: response regulator [Syntrophorhabdaceae bacterium]|nr:response regulator [Syntrophorhabdaceae bacterium]
MPIMENERKGQILIVDDDASVRGLLSQVLAEAVNYDIDMAADGVEGLEKVCSKQYDLIFTDLTMPRMSGMDFLQKSKEINASIPVIVLTGLSSMEVAVSAMRKGASDFLTKPFTIDKIIQTTRRVLGEWKLYGRLVSKQGSDESLKMLNAELFKRLQEIGALHSIGLEVDGCLDNREIYSRVAQMAAKLLAVREAFFGIVEGDRLNIRSSVGINSDLFPISGRLFDTVIRDKKHFIADIKKPHPYTGVELMSQFLAIPCLVGNDVFGILNLSGKTDSASFTEEEIFIAINLARKISSKIENNALYEALFNNVADTMKSIITMVGARDSYTKEHSDRVTMYSVLIAEAMGVPQGEISTLRFGGYLHDIGKIGVRDTVLLKPGKLSLGEIGEAQLHAVIGDEIVKPMNFFEKERKVIRNHHERYDGKGYPDGIGGEDIPIIVRILTVTDAYDAMTSHRPYRRALSVQMAVEELERCAGSQFDPAVVEAFKAILSEKEILDGTGHR